MEFVGRKKELDILLSKVEDSSENTIRIVFIAGEAGSGKTALIDKFEGHL